MYVFKYQDHELSTGQGCEENRVQRSGRRIPVYLAGLMPLSEAGDSEGEEPSSQNGHLPEKKQVKGWDWFRSLLHHLGQTAVLNIKFVCPCILGASWIWWNFWCIGLYSFWLKCFLDLVLFFSLLWLLHLFACRFYGRNSSYVHGGLDASGKPQEAVYGQAVSIKIRPVILVHVWNKARFFPYQWLWLS